MPAEGRLRSEPLLSFLGEMPEEWGEKLGDDYFL